MTDQRVRPSTQPRRITLRRVCPAGWWFDAAAVVGFVGVSLALATATARHVDLAVRDLADAHRPPIADKLAGWLNYVGSGGILTVIALLIALALGWRRRSAWPIAPVVAAFLLTGVVIGPLKLLLHRAAPHSLLSDQAEVRLFSQVDGASYPSGHAVNTIVWYGVIALLLAPWLHTTARRWLRFAPPVLVGFTATYLGYHWVSDMIAGLCLGVLIDRAIQRTPWPHVPPSQLGPART